MSATYAKNLQGGAGSNLPGLGQGQTDLPGDQRELVCCSSETGEMASLGTKTMCQVLSANLVSVFGVEFHLLV